MHPGWLRCSSLTYSRYARSSRLASRAPRHPVRHTYSVTGPKLTWIFQVFVVMKPDTRRLTGGPLQGDDEQIPVWEPKPRSPHLTEY